MLADYEGDSLSFDMILAPDVNIVLPHLLLKSTFVLTDIIFS